MPINFGAGDRHDLLEARLNQFDLLRCHGTLPGLSRAVRRNFHATPLEE
jgi:hypothetical protein